jgi:hypothetical protein
VKAWPVPVVVIFLYGLSVLMISSVFARRPIEHGHKADVDHIQGPRPIRSSDRSPSLVNVMRMTQQFRVMRGIVVLKNAVALSIQIDVCVVAFLDFFGGIQPSVDDQARAVPKDEHGMERTRAFHFIF